LLIGKGHAQAEQGVSKNISERLQVIMREQQLDEKSALKVVAKEKGLSRSEAYRELQRTRRR
jgi:16S rRNA (cytidine1402-2'-O)-methyltransferase